MDVHSPSPKPPGPKHHPANGATSATPVKARNSEQDAAAQSSNRRRRNNQNRGNKPQHQQVPAWDSTNVTDPNGGDFGANGNFISGQPKDSSDSAEGSPGPKKQNKRAAQPQKQQVRNNNYRSGDNSQPNADIERMKHVNATPAKQAYAGPTFHASPAASALPIPSFFSKSLPSVAAKDQPSLQARLDQESSSSDKSNDESPPTSSSIPASTVPPREESPLDFFFKADREEKAKRANSNGPATPNGKLSVPTLQSFQSAPPQPNNWAEIYGSGYRHHSRTASHDSQRAVFPLELDGTSAQPPHNISNSPIPPVDRQQPLRNFLNSTANNAPPQHLPTPEHHVSGYSSDHQNSSPFYRPQQVRSSSGPSTPSPYAQQNNPLHYGNRNLSPLFKAVGSNQISRSSSSLRREVTSSPTDGSVELPAFSTPPSSQPPSTIRSRSYGHENGRERSPHTQNTTPTPDVKSMEDDLRRMLKITAFGSGGAPAPGMA